MKITIFGARGSIPTPGIYTKKYGGNTTSILIEFDDNNFIIIDAGTGIKNLGDYLLKNYKKPFDINILITHTHWDHIMGLPFFTPIYMPGTKITFWGPFSIKGKSLKDIVTGQMTYEYFPVNYSEVAAAFFDRELREGEYEIDDYKIETILLNHPILTLGYKIKYKNKIIVTCYDHEVYQNLFNKDDDEIDEETYKDAEIMTESLNQRINGFVAGADLVIYDSQYTKKEYYTKFRGWGHSYYEWVLKVGLENEIKKLIFHHHDPSRTDMQLDYIKQWLQNIIKKKNSALQIDLSTEMKPIFL